MRCKVGGPLPTRYAPVKITVAPRAIRVRCASSNLTGLIDVNFPYNTVQGLCLTEDGGAAIGFVRRESHNPLEPYSALPMSELIRHSAILGSTVVAAANPVKQKHYYLAFQGSFKLATAEVIPPLTSEDYLHLKARLTRPFGGPMACVAVDALLPGSVLYATTQVRGAPSHGEMRDVSDCDEI